MTDAVKMLNVVAGYDPGDPATAWNVGHLKRDYTPFLDADGLKGARIGIVETLFGKEPVHQEVNTVVHEAIRRMEQAGAITVPIRDPMLDTNKLVSEVSVHLYDLKPDLNSYLSDPKANAPVKSPWRRLSPPASSTPTLAMRSGGRRASTRTAPNTRTGCSSG